MNQIYAEASQVLVATPEQIYAILADYQQGHRAILPKPYFIDLQVEDSQPDEHTRVRVHMKLLGVEREFYQIVTEPVPKRLLLEVDVDTGGVTAFAIEPTENLAKTRVTISTVSIITAGFAGFVEKLLLPFALRQMYNEELHQLATYIQSEPTVPHAS